MKRLTLFSILIYIAFASYGQGAIFSWAQNYTTPIDKIELDSLSNIYSIGDGSITKRTPSGTLLWTRTITTIQSLAVTPNGDIYITGGFSGTVNFNGWGAGYPLTSAGNKDIFVSKLNTNGDFVWAQRIGDVGADSATQISLDTLGHIYLTGKFTGSVDFDPGPSTDVLGNGTDFILKLDTASNYVWGRQIDLIGITPAVIAPAIIFSDVDATGKITCVTNKLNGTFDLNPGVGVNSITATMEHALFQLDANGNFNWANKIVTISPFYCSITLLKVDLAGNIYISGEVRGEYNILGYVTSTSFSSGNQFIVKCNSNGGLLLGKQIISQSGASGDIFPGGLDVDNSGNIYLSGVYQNGIYFDGIPYGSSGLGMAYNFYTCKILPNTQFEWIRIFGWNINPIYNSPSIRCVAISSNGCLYNSGVTGTINQLDMNFVNSATQPFYIYPSTNGTNFLQQICQTTCPSFNNFDTDTVACYKVNNGNIIGTSGTYSITYVSSQGCDSIVNTNLTLLNPAIDTIIVSACDSFIYNNQVFCQSGIYPFITNGPPPPMGCLSGTVLYLTVNSLLANVTQSGTTLTVQNLNAGCQWVDCNNNFAPIPNETNPYFTPNQNGSYAVIIASSGCVDTSNCFVFNGLDTTEYINNNPIQLYPNPTSNIVTLKSSFNMQDATLRIYNMNGALLYEQMNLNGSKFQLKLSQYANGLYQIEIINQGVQYRSKVRKE